MNEEDSIALFLALTIETARSLPLSKATAFLRGALAVANDHPAMTEVRSAYMLLHNADAQLDLIAWPQTKPGQDGEAQDGDGEHGNKAGRDGDGHDGGHAK